MFVLLFLHLTPAHAGTCVRKGGCWGPPEARGRGRPSAGRTRSGLLRKLAVPVREAVAGPAPAARPAPRASFAADAAGRCADTERGRLLPAWRPHAARWRGGPAAIPKTSRDRPSPPWGLVPQPASRGSREGGWALRAHACLPGDAAVPPRPPEHARLFVCLGDFRKRRVGLSGYWYCFFTPTRA